MSVEVKRQLPDVLFKDFSNARVLLKEYTVTNKLLRHEGEARFAWRMYLGCPGGALEASWR